MQSQEIQARGRTIYLECLWCKEKLSFKFSRKTRHYSLFDIHLLLSMTVLFSGWWNIPYLLKNPGGFIKFFMIRVQRLFLSGIFTKGSVYLKSNLFLANNSMVTDQGKQKYYRSCYWLSSWFLLKELKIKSYLQCSLLGAKSNLHWKSSKVCIITKSPLASLLLKV